MRWRFASVITAVAVSCFAPHAWAQVPAGGEFQVNTYTTVDQWFPVVHTEVDGDFQVVWISLAQDGSGSGVFAQRYGRDGAARGAEFQVNTYTTSYQGYLGGADISGDGRGGFVVVWSSDGQDGDGFGVFGQRYDSTGTAAGAEFQVNTYTTGYQGSYVQGSVGVAQAANGSFVVVWDAYPSASDSDVVGQRFDSTGNRIGGEFQVNTYTTGYQWRPDIAMDASGSFVVVWGDAAGQDGSGAGVFGQRFDESGGPLGGQFQVNTYTTGNQSGGSYFGPAVARGSLGEFVVLWDDSAARDGSNGAVFGQRFDASGNRVGSDFQVNTYTTGSQILSTVSMDTAGNFVTSWTSYPQDGSSYGVFGQRFTAAGLRRGSEFQVNSDTTGAQFFPEIGTDEVGNFTLTWFDASRDGSGYGTFARRFGGLFPAALAADPTGNGVIEPGETAELRPSWSNLNGAAQAFGGGLSNLSGPAGPTYTITDATGDYGTVANGASAPCTDCYGVIVSGTRPAQHWDASVLEGLTPDTQGQQKTWRLHLGDSFADVPNSSGFYRFIETLLHHGVTGGCSATDYCPVSTATREQMAVFTLVAKDGPATVPPACAPPNLFTDVPETSPFCRWIEELANRGVVGGCGGGNYCPTSPVTREQMSIFVLRTLDPALTPPACSAPNLFGDVPETSPFCRWIEELANRGVVSGCGGGNYCPTDPVTREQMAVFISAGFGLTLYGP